MKQFMDHALKTIFCEPYIEIPDRIIGVILFVIFLVAGFGGSW